MFLPDLALTWHTKWDHTGMVGTYTYGGSHAALHKYTTAEEVSSELTH